jgi:hypothetical protein
MGLLQDIARAPIIIDAMEAMESISRYPDLTRLGILEGAGAGLGLVTIIRVRCAGTVVKEEAVLALVELTRSTLQAI